MSRVVKGGTRPQRRLFFIHPFKTGGTTIHDTLTRLVDLGRVLPFGHFGTPFEHLPRERWLEAAPALASDFDFIGGHLPCARALFERVQQDGAPWRLVVALRHPVDRVVSRYHHLRRTPRSDYEAAPAAQQRLIDAANGLPLAQLLDSDDPLVRANFRDHQVRMLAGDMGEPGDEALARAREVLQRADVIFLTEFMALSFALAARALDDRPLRLPARLNTGEYEAADPALRERIAAANLLDMQLFADACREFGRRAQALGVPA